MANFFTSFARRASSGLVGIAPPSAVHFNGPVGSPSRAIPGPFSGVGIVVKPRGTQPRQFIPRSNAVKVHPISRG